MQSYIPEAKAVSVHPNDPQQYPNAEILNSSPLVLESVPISQNIPISQTGPSSIADRSAAVAYLTRNGWPIGLQDTLLSGLNRLPMRFFIVDDSGSMATSDGHRLIVQGSIRKMVPCDRWTELTDAMRFHVGSYVLLAIITSTSGPFLSILTCL